MHWVVVMTKPNCEHIAVANLTQQGYLCYAPRFKAVRPNKTPVIKPLFPRYVFSFIDTLWYSIQGTRGVSRLLMGHDGPQKLPASIIHNLQDREDGEGFIVLKTPDEQAGRFRPGDKVTAVSGPLAGHFMLYQGMTGKDRVQVLLSMFGRQSVTTIDEKILVAA